MSLHIRHARGFWKVAIGETRYRKVLLLDGLCLEKMTLREIKKKQKKREVEIRKTKHAKEIKLYTTAMSQETPVAVIGPTLWKESPQRNRKSN